MTHTGIFTSQKNNIVTNPYLPYSNNLLFLGTGRNTIGYTLTGTNIDSQEDSSGNSNDVSSVDPYRPTQVNEGLFKSNQYLNASPKYLGRSDSLGLVGNPDHTIILVLKFDTIPAGPVNIFQLGRISNLEFGKKLAIIKSGDFGGTRLILSYQGGTSGAFVGGAYKYYNYEFTTNRIVLTISKPAGGVPDSSRLYINNSTTALTLGVSSSNWVASRNLNLDNDGFYMGSQVISGVPSLGFNGLLDETIIYGENLSEVNRLSVVNHLMTEWGVT